MSPPILTGVPGPVAPVVELGIGDRYDASTVAALWGTARWSTAGVDNEWGGTEPLWHDITCEVLEASTYCGRDGSVEVFNVATATVVVRNLDGWADYQPDAHPDNVLTVRPGRQLRIGVQIAGGPSQWLWRGVVDVTEPGYRPGEGDIVTLGCVDAKGDVGRAEIPRMLAPVGYGERGYQRCWRILDNAGWPRSRRNFDVDNVQLLATEFGTQVADELDRTAESVSGHVYGDTAGKIRFRRKDWMVWAATTPPDATIGNVGGGDVCPSGWEQRFGRDDLTTVAIVGRSGETPLVMTDSEALGLYGNEPWNREDLLAADTFEIARVGSRVLSARSPETMPRIAAVTLDAATGGGEVAVLLASCSPFTPSRFRVRHNVGARLVFDRTMMVVGVEHILSPSDGWSARIALDDAMPYRNVDNPARWSDPTARWSTDDQWALSL